MSVWANFADIYNFTGNAWQKYAKRNGIGAGNPANWLVNSKQTCLTSPPEYKCRVIFVLVLAINVLYEVQLDNNTFYLKQLFWI